MAYSELIKNFESIRDYVREFYVYGFKSREEYTAKSARSYDNERRRIESWMGDYMSFRQNASGKNVFLSVDSRNVGQNPLYKAFRAKSFTALDITLHFYIFDLLAGNRCRTVREIVSSIETDYLYAFDKPLDIDESTVRKKLKEYEALGLLKSEKRGRELTYSRTEEDIDLESWRDASGFFSEADPLGVAGAFLLDKYTDLHDYFSFKHHYILHALEGEVLYELLDAISGHRSAAITLVSARRRRESSTKRAIPLKIYVSTQTGRRYLLCYHHGLQHLMSYRLDSIRSVKVLDIEPEFEKYLGYAEKYNEYMWGMSHGESFSLDHIEMLVRVGPGEEHILQRLKRERRCGRIEKIDAFTYSFIADVYDANEMLPWIRTFIGRITGLKCNNEYVTETFFSDMNALRQMYGGDGNAVQ